MFIQRNTKATGNEASRQNLVEAGRRNGAKGKGRKKPWLSNQMKQRWEKGDFDFHNGRVRPEEEVARLKASFTSERRAKISARLAEQWRDPEYRERLCRFHRSEEERSRRSREQSLRVKRNPKKWTRGKGCYVRSPKCRDGAKFWVRSSYEVAAVSILDADDDVDSFKYEPRVQIEGRYILPDFLVTHRKGSATLVEVKASWVLELDDKHSELLRLDLSRQVAAREGWDFAIWTERDRLKNAI